MAVRDRVVLCALGGGAVLAILGGLLLGLWIALVVPGALAAAALAYRIQAPRIDVEQPDAWEVRASDASEHVDR